MNDPCLLVMNHSGTLMLTRARKATSIENERFSMI
jgi:hypothetical protein